LLPSFSSGTALAVATRQRAARSTRGKDHVECIDQRVEGGDGWRDETGGAGGRESGRVENVLLSPMLLGGCVLATFTNRRCTDETHDS